MKKYKLISQLVLFVFSGCYAIAQNKIQANDTLSLPKIKKNYFITQYPQDIFAVQCGLQDQKGHLWFGSGPDGIYFYDGKTFVNFTRADGLCHNDILCCLEDKSGNIWFGTRHGLIRYHPSGEPPARKDFKSFYISANVTNNSNREKMSYEYKVVDNFVWSIMQDKTGKIWFGTGNGIYTYDPLVDKDNDTPLFREFIKNDSLVNKSDLHLKDVLSMIQDKEGKIWFTSGYLQGEGICCYDGRSLTNFKPDSIKQFRSVLESKNGGMFFLSSFHGVYSYDGKTFFNYTKKMGVNDTVVSMMEDNDGKLWLGTSGGNFSGSGKGLWCIDGKDLKLFTTDNGLSHNSVFCIVPDKAGNLWFGTRNVGLCKFDGKSFTDFTDRGK